MSATQMLHLKYLALTKNLQLARVENENKFEQVLH